MVDVTWTPFRKLLSNGPASVTMLSPSTATTRTGTGLRFGKVNVQPEVSLVATISWLRIVLSPLSGITRTAHLPAMSASAIGAGAAGAAVASAISSAAGWALSLLQATRTTAQQHMAKRRIGLSVVEDCWIKILQRSVEENLRARSGARKRPAWFDVEHMSD